MVEADVRGVNVPCSLKEDRLFQQARVPGRGSAGHELRGSLRTSVRSPVPRKEKKESWSRIPVFGNRIQTVSDVGLPLHRTSACCHVSAASPPPGVAASVAGETSDQPPWRGHIALRRAAGADEASSARSVPRCGCRPRQMVAPPDTPRSAKWRATLWTRPVSDIFLLRHLPALDFTPHAGARHPQRQLVFCCDCKCVTDRGT